MPASRETRLQERRPANTGTARTWMCGATSWRWSAAAAMTDSGPGIRLAHSKTSRPQRSPRSAGHGSTASWGGGPEKKRTTAQYGRARWRSARRRASAVPDGNGIQPVGVCRHPRMRGCAPHVEHGSQVIARAGMTDVEVRNRYDKSSSGALPRPRKRSRSGTRPDPGSGHEVISNEIRTEDRSHVGMTSRAARSCAETWTGASSAEERIRDGRASRPRTDGVEK